MRLRRPAWTKSPMAIITVVVAAWFILTFLIVPNAHLLLEVFEEDGKFSTGAWGRLFASDRAMSSLRNSALLAVTLSLTVNAFGIFIVLVTKYFRIRGQRFLWLGFATNLIYGGIVLVAGYDFVYGSTGTLTKALTTVIPAIPVDWFQGFPAVLYVMTFATTGNHLLFLTAAMARVDQQTVESATQMGASTWTVLRRVVLPVLKPTIFAITILTFLSGLGALAAPQILGGRSFQTIAPMILTFANSPGSRDLAAALALILATFTIALLLIMNRIERGGTYFSISKVSSRLEPQPIRHPVGNAIVHALAYLLLLVYILPPLLIAIFSFTDAKAISTGTLRFDSFTLENYIQVVTDPVARWPFIVSIGYSGLAALIVIIGLLFVVRIITLYRGKLGGALEYLLHIPWIMPGSMIALGLLLTFSTPRALAGGQVLSGTLVILLIAFVIGKIPFTLRLLKASFLGINRNMEEAASLLGASQFTTFRRIILPLVLPTAAAITALNFQTMLDDYDTAVFLAHPLYQPLGLFIRSATSGETTADSTALVFVYTVLLMIISGIAMWLVYGDGVSRLRRLVGRIARPTSPAKDTHR